jgi:hypothetical protein
MPDDGATVCSDRAAGRRRWTARELAVLGVYTGEGVGGLIREQFSPRATFVAMTLLLVANAA